ncbi:hypothetical protein HPT27_01350 [Permianibacter sp. IMCC34836]|uniref:hypothetical protein n=1 Tax=Permianibacter fluminis TaxID=2738515 RepID=UPI0015525136|nr:hypothetical protein [Permianibacter fluminis]NQD35648.1 hypothetical protein [Permianibacter fluminis]
MYRFALLIVLAALFGPATASAELPVQQSWQCQVGGILVVSNTPCSSGAQPVSAATSVIYHCQHNGVSSFQQRPCGAHDDVVHLYRDERTAATLASGQKVRADTLAQAQAARSAPAAKGGGVTVVGATASANRTAGDGKSDGYRSPSRAPKSNSGY